MEQSYSRQYGQLWQHHWWWRSRRRLVLRWVEKITAGQDPALGPAKILDIGCGAGWAMDDWARFGDVFGVEPDAELLRDARVWQHRIDNQAFDRDYLPLRLHDVIVMLDVLEHIDDDSGAICNLYRALKPGGVAILTVPALRWLWSVHDEANHHYRRYSRHGLRRLLRRRGFDIEFLRYFFVWPVGLMSLRRFAAGRSTDYAVRTPAALVNGLARGLSDLENVVLDGLKLRPPLGGSLLAVVRRPRHKPGGQSHPAARPPFAAWERRIS